jgi:creatinine amidohydrolase
MGVDLRKLNFMNIKEIQPEVAILPWGATEAHNYHLPYCSDVIQAEQTALKAAEIAETQGAKPVVLPAIPFGNDAQQLDQYVTIHLSTSSAKSILNDIVSSLTRQGIDRLIVVNSHGGNNFKSLVRDLEAEFDILIIIADLFAMVPEKVEEIFEEPGDHAGEMETSFMMYLTPYDVYLKDAGEGKRNKFKIDGLDQKGVWTPRPWSNTHPDLGSGNPRKASREKGERYFNALCDALATVITGLSKAGKGDLPYV